MDLHQYLVSPTSGQVEKILRMVRQKKPYVRIRFKHEQIGEGHPMLFSKYQVGRLERAKKKRMGTIVEFVPDQILDKSGGQLGAIFAILAPVLGAIASQVIAPRVSKFINEKIDNVGKKKKGGSTSGKALYPYGGCVEGSGALYPYGSAPKGGKLFPYGVSVNVRK